MPSNFVNFDISKFLISLIFEYRYFLLFPVMVIEGPLTAMGVGFLVSLKVMSAFISFPIVVVGDVAGDILYYWLGRFGERWRLTRWLTRKFKFEASKEKLMRSFKKQGGKLLLFGKLTHALGAAFLIGAGYFKMDLRQFIWYNTLGTIIKSAVLMYVGYLAGSAYEAYSRYFEIISLFVSIGSIAAIIIFMYISRWFGDRFFDWDRTEEGDEQ